jgi:hypothetical protein
MALLLGTTDTKQQHNFQETLLLSSATFGTSNAVNGHGSSVKQGPTAALQHLYMSL